MRRGPGIAAAIAVLLTATGCSGSETDDDKADPEAAPAPSPTAASAQDEADVVAVIAAYDRALVTVNREQAVTDQLEQVATDAWAAQLLSTYEDNVFSNGLVITGRQRTEVRSVAVDGDAAWAEVCSDGSRVYVVEAGSETDGAQSRGRTRGVITLVREAGGWQVDGNASEEGRC